MTNTLRTSSLKCDRLEEQVLLSVQFSTKLKSQRIFLIIYSKEYQFLKKLLSNYVVLIELFNDFSVYFRALINYLLKNELFLECG
jgi:hypothetical protein